MRVLDAGIDSLYWSVRVPVGPWYANVLRAKEAAAAGDPPEWTVRGYCLEVVPHWMGSYPVAARAAEFELRFTDSEHIPTVYTQLRSSFIRSVGAEAAVAESVAVVSEITGAEGIEPQASRIDVFADFSDFRVLADGREGFHTRCEVAAHFGPDSDQLHSIRVGSDRFKLRLYDKRRELTKRAEPMPLAWGAFDGDVTRVEIEADARALRRFGIRGVGEAIGSCGDLWRYGTGRFFVMREPGAGPKRFWPVRPEWEFVQSAGLDFPTNGLIPFYEAAGDKIRVLRVAYGCLISLGAFLDKTDLAEVVRALPREIEAVRNGRSYPDAVRRRRRRLPRAVRSGT